MGRPAPQRGRVENVVVGNGGKAVKELLSTVEAAEWLGLEEATLREWRSDQKGPPYIEISARCIRYALKDLEKYIAERRVVPSVNFDK